MLHSRLNLSLPQNVTSFLFEIWIGWVIEYNKWNGTCEFRKCIVLDHMYVVYNKKGTNLSETQHGNNMQQCAWFLWSSHKTGKYWIKWSQLITQWYKTVWLRLSSPSSYLTGQFTTIYVMHCLSSSHTVRDCFISWSDCVLLTGFYMFEKDDQSDCCIFYNTIDKQ